MNILYVALGSAVGGIGRYGVTLLMNKVSCGPFPLSTFAVNVIGCFVIGLLNGWIARGEYISAETRLFMITGFCGGFTTFSTFSHENYLLFSSEKDVPIAVIYTALSFFTGLLMIYAGHKTSYIL